MLFLVSILQMTSLTHPVRHCKSAAARPLTSSHDVRANCYPVFGLVVNQGHGVQCSCLFFLSLFALQIFTGSALHRW